MSKSEPDYIKLHVAPEGSWVLHVGIGVVFLRLIKSAFQYNVDTGENSVLKEPNMR